MKRIKNILTFYLSLQILGAAVGLFVFKHTCQLTKQVDLSVLHSSCCDEDQQPEGLSQGDCCLIQPIVKKVDVSDVLVFNSNLVLAGVPFLLVQHFNLSFSVFSFVEKTLLYFASDPSPPLGRFLLFCQLLI